MMMPIRVHQALAFTAFVVLLPAMVMSADDAGASPNAETETIIPPETDSSLKSSSSSEQQQEEEATSFNAQEHTDWGTYYDPQNVFCGQYDCYQILGFDYESFYGTEKPSKQIITKRYRSLSREWHPDKSKRKDAKERFVKIARAYEVLTDNDKRAEYDMMRYDQEAYYKKYGANVLWSYAPKSDVTMILLVICVVANLFTWYAQQARWQQVANRLIKAAVEDWSPSMGGSPESKQLREQAAEILKERQAATEDATTSNGTTTTTTTAKAKKNKKISGKEKKQQEQDLLKPIITELVHEMKDFGAGFHQPSWRDLFVVRLVKFPLHLGSGVVWQTKYYVRRFQGKELNEEERRMLTERAVGHVSWELATDEDRDAMVERELWVLDNLVAWKEEQEIKKLSKSEQKMYAKMKKRGIDMKED